MKNLLKFFGTCLFLVVINSCKKEEDTIMIQKHDENEVMKLMHQMLDRMEQMTMTKDPDIDFAMMMKMHHQGAIDMAKFELQNGSDAEIKSMAQSIITTQEAEIKELDSFLSQNTPKVPKPDFDNQMMEIMNKMDRNADLQIINGKVDHDFSILMTGHHQSAIEMSNLELMNGNNSQLKQLASKIIKDQQKEIKDFQEWLLSNRN